MSNVVNAFKSDAVDFVFGCTRYDSCISYVQTSKSLNFNARGVSLSACIDSTLFKQTLGVDASYFMGPQIWNPSSSSSSYTYALTNYSSTDFASEYTNRYGEVPVYQGAAAFALPFILLDAITRAGTVSNVTRVMNVLSSPNYTLETTYGT